jgi:hypothetical protein
MRAFGIYLPPYLKKVAKLEYFIRILDCFAGPGSFEMAVVGKKRAGRTLLVSTSEKVCIRTREKTD